MRPLCMVQGAFGRAPAWPDMCGNGEWAPVVTRYSEGKRDTSEYSNVWSCRVEVERVLILYSEDARGLSARVLTTGRQLMDSLWPSCTGSNTEVVRQAARLGA